jgi:hypothetical protein
LNRSDVNQTIILAHDMARNRAKTAIESAQTGWVVSIHPPKRSNGQNAALWSALTEISEQVVWHGQKLTEDEWKIVLTAGLKRQKVVNGIDGGFVVLGQSTSKMNKTEMSELLELVYSFGVQQGVKFSVPE